MCSVSNQTPVQMRLAFESASCSHTDDESFIQLKMAPQLVKTKRYSHKLSRATDPIINTTSNLSSSSNDNQKTSTSHTKKSSKLRTKHTVSISSSPDTSFMALNENDYGAENEFHYRSSLVSPPRNRHSKNRRSGHHRQPTDTDELLRKVSVQLMRAQNGDASRKSDKNKTSDITKSWTDSQRSVTLSSIESQKLSLDNISPTSDDCGQFSGASTPDQQVSGQSDTIDEDQLRMACEHIIEQQRKAWVAFKKSKKSGRRSLIRPVLNDEMSPLKEIPLSNTSCETIDMHCKNEVVSLKASTVSEEGHISSEQFDSGHGSSEEHETGSTSGNTNTCVPMSRPHYRYYLRRQKGHFTGSKPQVTCNTTSDSVSSPLETATGTMKTNTSKDHSSSSYTAGYSRLTTSKIESMLEPHPSSSPSRVPSYLSSHVCSSLNSCSSSSSSSIVDIQQLTTNCCTELLESAVTVSIPTEEETFLNCSSPIKKTKSPKRTVRQEETINVDSLSPSHSLKNSSKKENNKSNVKLSSTLTRGCMSCGFFANACSKITQIRKTLSGKNSNILPSTKTSGV